MCYNFAAQKNPVKNVLQEIQIVKYASINITQTQSAI